MPKGRKEGAAGLSTGNLMKMQFHVEYLDGGKWVKVMTKENGSPEIFSYSAARARMEAINQMKGARPARMLPVPKRKAAT